jgi:hypothetical protein
MEEDLIWIKEWKSPFQLDDDLKVWLAKCNTYFPHSSLNNKTPDQFEKTTIMY